MEQVNLRMGLKDSFHIHMYMEASSFGKKYVKDVSSALIEYGSRL